jgi:hypothetical protein
MCSNFEDFLYFLHTCVRWPLMYFYMYMERFVTNKGD